MLEVLRHEAILNRIAVIIKRLHHVISPLPAQAHRSAIEDLIKLDEQLDYFRMKTAEPHSPRAH